MQAGADKDDETKNGSPLICAASHGDAASSAPSSTLAPTSNCSMRTLRPNCAPRVRRLRIPRDRRRADRRRRKDQLGDRSCRRRDLTGWSIAELSDFERASALRAAAVNERLTNIDRLLAAGTPIDAEVDGHPAIHWDTTRPIEGSRTPR